MNSTQYLPQILLIAFGLLSLWLAFKIAHIVLKILLHLTGLALVGGAIWWCFFRT